MGKGPFVGVIRPQSLMNAALCTEWYFVLVGKYIDLKTKINVFLYCTVKK